jgi:GntR family transcriptional regulator
LYWGRRLTEIREAGSKFGKLGEATYVIRNFSGFWQLLESSPLDHSQNYSQATLLPWPIQCITIPIHMDENPLIFEINATSGMPIYRQIVDQVHAMLAGGQLREGDLLPSVRQVAQNAAVNPMTVSKAYSRLETEGVVRRARGLGMQVLAPPQNGSVDDRKEQFRVTIEPALHRARQLGLSSEQIREVISSLIQDQQS